VEKQNQTDEICKLAVKQNGEALKYVENQTDEICKLAVQTNGCALKYVKNSSKEIIEIALLKNINAIKFCSYETKNKYKQMQNIKQKQYNVSLNILKINIDDIIKYNKVKDLCDCLLLCVYFNKEHSNVKKIVNMLKYIKKSKNI
jgi:hypothetical protein